MTRKHRGPEASISVRLPLTALEALSELADETGHSYSFMGRTLLMEALRARGIAVE